jgi:hypothetical protein
MDTVQTRAVLGPYRGGADLAAFTFKCPVLPVGHLNGGYCPQPPAGLYRGRSLVIANPP